MSLQLSGYAPQSEWLEADGYGGFASGTVSGVRTRRYHALLLTATRPPLGRVVLVNGFEAWLTTPRGRYALTSQRYHPDVIYPDGAERLRHFAHRPWPTWTFELEDGLLVELELLNSYELRGTLLRWRLAGPNAAAEGKLATAKLELRLLISGRDFHALHRENTHFDFGVLVDGAALRLRPYPDLPEVRITSNAHYTPAPCWYRNFLYSAEQERGLDHIEDLASPGVLNFDLAAGPAWLALQALMLDTGAEKSPHGAGTSLLPSATPAQAVTELERLREAESLRRAERGTGWQAAAESYIVQRGRGETLIAGYPWFGDWGRDTFIALRGLCLARGRVEAAGRILEQWSEFVSEGMLPNRFPDDTASPEYNSVDASLWYVIAVHDYLEHAARATAEATLAPGSASLGADATREHGLVGQQRRARLLRAVSAILQGYTRGTRFNIHRDDDGLLACGIPGVQLTWMDAKVGDWVVTPRSGKPVEVQALWLNALHIAATYESQYAESFERGLRSFHAKFWRADLGMLCDTVDVAHEPGRVDLSLRPNQILAVGGLPRCLLAAHEAQSVVAIVEAQLLTPLGLRTLSPSDANYRPTYRGSVQERDGAYHQGTVWPWLLGPFVEAWLRVYGASAENRQIARRRFLTPLLQHLEVAGLGHVSEIAAGAAPHEPAGAPFQAWSLGELIRIDRLLAPGADATNA